MSRFLLRFFFSFFKRLYYARAWQGAVPVEVVFAFSTAFSPIAFQ